MLMQDTHIKLVPIKKKDVAAVYALMQRIYPPVYAYLWEDKGAQYLQHTYSQTNLTAELSNPNTHYYFVRYLSQTIGIFKYDLQAQGRIKLHRIYLQKDHHGKGIGKTLLQALVANYQHAYQELWLEAMVSESQAVRFYQKLGFEIIDQYALSFPGLYSKYNQMYQMRKSLKP